MIKKIKGNYDKFSLWRLIIGYFCFIKLLGGTKEYPLFHGNRVMHCVKSVEIGSFFWSVFSCIPVLVNLRIQSEYRKIWTWKNSVFGYFSRSDESKSVVWIFEIGTVEYFWIYSKNAPGNFWLLSRIFWNEE